jgi:hypothetical protein
MSSVSLLSLIAQCLRGSIGGRLSVTESWIAGREAVHAVSKFFLDQKWIFMEVPGYADFGKDGYVDMVTVAGEVTGRSFAVQIKGGRSRRRGGGYRIESTLNNRQQWHDSTMPVIGIVWDPDLSELFWIDLTATLNDLGLSADLSVPSSRHLCGQDGLRRFTKYIGSVAHRQASILDLLSPNPELQMAGVAAGYHIGRTDGRRGSRSDKRSDGGSAAERPSSRLGTHRRRRSPPPPNKRYEPWDGSDATRTSSCADHPGQAVR